MASNGKKNGNGNGNGRPGPRRTPDERERDRAEIATLYLEGKTLRAIAAEISKRHYPDQDPLSFQLIGADLTLIRKRWLSEQIISFGEVKARELARVDKLESEYWSEYERSKLSKRRDIVKGGGRGRDPDYVEKTEVREGRLGDPRYLQGIQWCISERCKILGIYAAVKNLDIDMRELTTEQLIRVANGEDIISVIVSANGDARPVPS